MEYTEIVDLILDDENYTVGGGSASAIMGAMACGLIGMVINLSPGKDYGLSDETYTDLAEELRELKAKLLRGSVEDHEAYLLIRDAYRLPKSTDEEKAERKKAIEQAGIAASNVPLSNAKLNKRVHEIGLEVLGKSNPAAGTDLQAGIDLAEKGMYAAKSNVEVNLPMIKDENVLEEFKAELKLF